eukprot:7605268-Ditylum_brightwellii.AAC.1
MDYFELIELLKVVKQHSKTIVVDDGTDKQKKSSSQCTKSAKSETSAKGKLPGKDKKDLFPMSAVWESPNYCTAKDCYRHKVIMLSKMQTSCKCPTGDHMSMEDLHASNLKLAKKLKKYKKKGKCKSTHVSESSNFDSDSS